MTQPQNTIVTNDSERVWWHGDKGQYTGKALVIDGGDKASKTYYQIVLLEGHMVRQTKWIVTPPKNGGAS